MYKLNRKEVLYFELTQTLRYEFADRCEVRNLLITIKSVKATALLILVPVVALPFLMVLIFSKGDIILSLNFWPLSLFFFLLCLVPVYQSNNHDNDVSFNFSEQILTIENKHFMSKQGRVAIHFEDIDRFFCKPIRSGKTLEFILNVIDKTEKNFIVQEMFQGERVSQILNEMIRLRQPMGKVFQSRKLKD